MQKHLPNFVTLINLFCGCAALVSVLNEQFNTAFYFLLAAGLADYGDGFLARLLKVNSDLGKELDSLADIVSFGVVPGAILYTLLINALGADTEGAVVWAALPGFVLPMFACLRLAKFNLDTRQSENFIGLNTPAATILVTGLMLVFQNDTAGLRAMISQPWLLYSITAILSFLLVAELPMASFKFKGLKWKGNEFRFIFILLSIILMILLKELAFTIIIILYILYSVIRYFVK